MTESKDLAQRVEVLEAELQKAKGERDIWAAEHERQIEEKRELTAEVARQDAALRAMVCDYTTPEAALEQVRYTAQRHAEEHSKAHARIVKLSDERDALAAELKALREQEPVATLRNSSGHIGGLHFDNHAPDTLEAGMKLYARSIPGFARLTVEQIEKADEAIREALGDAYDCMRVWSAWGNGTMGPGDFWPVAESDERVAEIREAVVAGLGIQPVEAGGRK